MDAILALPASSLTLVVGALLGIICQRIISDLRRIFSKGRNRKGWSRYAWRRSGVQAHWKPKPATQTLDQHDAADQLRIVMASSFNVRSLLNRGEARLFRELDRMVIERNPAWQVMAQVSLGEVLNSTNPEAYRCINSKRVDLLLMDDECKPRHAIEYQGSGHYHSNAAARDAVKKEALRRAGIGYHEVIAGQTTPSALKRLIEMLVDSPSETRATGA